MLPQHVVAGIPENAQAPEHRQVDTLASISRLEANTLPGKRAGLKYYNDLFPSLTEMRALQWKEYGPDRQPLEKPWSNQLVDSYYTKWAVCSSPVYLKLTLSTDKFIAALRDLGVDVVNCNPWSYLTVLEAWHGKVYEEWELWKKEAVRTPFVPEAMSLVEKRLDNLVLLRNRWFLHPDIVTLIRGDFFHGHNVQLKIDSNNVPEGTDPQYLVGLLRLCNVSRAFYLQQNVLMLALERVYVPEGLRQANDVNKRFKENENRRSKRNRQREDEALVVTHRPGDDEQIDWMFGITQQN